ncbi:tripartite tricarboxylate transporter substrate binding protein [Pigmentiphaga sp.]|uniref:Bug family tripartite tricarboxylate transporter substrate binding protein n=1 Tax=Pigmentiphaga sp. TaxID=1977564 RepID=UPI0025E133E1|nr:tripartite tricarboxylate transporter substrate binding protein [Pigmentiphaga sp.]
MFAIPPHRLRTAFAVFTSIAAGSMGAGPASAQGAASWPSQPIRFIVPYPTGTQTDITARIIGNEITQATGQPVIVDNRPGASTLIGAEALAKSAPDGYTIMLTTNTTSAANKSLFIRLPYDPLKDFAYVGLLNTTSQVLVGRADIPANTLDEFLAWARKQKNLEAGHWSAGSQVSVAMLKSLGGIDLLPVPYKGGPQAVTDVLGGQIALTFTDFSSALPHIKNGKLKGIGITAPKRSSVAPQIPALAESIPGFDVLVWTAIVAPAGTPQSIIAKLNGIVNHGLARPEVKAKFADIGFDVSPSSPEELTRFVEREIDRWKKLVDNAGIAPQ